MTQTELELNMSNEIQARALVQNTILEQNLDIELSIKFKVESTTGKIKELEIQKPQDFLFSVSELIGWITTINHYIMQGALEEGVEVASKDSEHDI